MNKIELNHRMNREELMAALYYCSRCGAPHGPGCDGCDCPRRHIYELRVDGDGVYYTLGLFDSIEAIRDLIARHDGPSETGTGSPLHEHGDDGELLRIVRHEVGVLCPDCGESTVALWEIAREWYGHDPDDPRCAGTDEDDHIWESEWRELSEPGNRVTPGETEGV